MQTEYRECKELIEIKVINMLLTHDWTDCKMEWPIVTFGNCLASRQSKSAMQQHYSGNKRSGKAVACGAALEVRLLTDWPAWRSMILLFTLKGFLGTVGQMDKQASRQTCAVASVATPPSTLFSITRMKNRKPGGKQESHFLKLYVFADDIKP